MAITTVGVNVVVTGAARATSEVNRFGRSLRGLSDAGGQAGRGIGAVAGIVPALGARLRSASDTLQNFGRRMTAMGSIISTVGFRMSAMIGIPIVAFFKSTAQAAAEFEDELTKMVTLVGLGARQVEDIGGRLLELAPALGVTPVQLAAATYFVLSNGITDTATAMDIVTRSAKGTAIGLGETEAIAKILTAAVISYSDENFTAAEAADQLTAAVQRGSVEADEFAAPLGRMLGLASNLGVTFAEATSFITTFTSSGISVSQAVTGLNRVMLSFLNPTEEAKAALKEIGTDAQQLRTTLGEQGLARTLVGLREAFARSNLEFSEFVSRSTGLNAALFVTGGALDRYLDTVQVVEAANGTLNRSFEVVTETTSFQFNQLKAQLQVLAITIGAILLPAINQIIQRLLPLVAAVAEFAKQHPQIVLIASAFGLLAAVMGPVVIAMGLFISSLGLLASTIGGMLGLLLTLVTWPTVLATALAGAALTIGGLFVASLKKMGKEVDLSFEAIVNRARIWGKNIIISLANGILDAAVFIVRALIRIGRIIASWLSPGSPPRLLPDLPEWGANAMSEFLRGFTEADFGIFRDISGVVAGFFRSLEGRGISEEGVIPAILGSRQAIAQAIAQINETGTVTQAVLNRISGSFGSVSQDIRDYVLILADLKRAQNEVAAAQREIDEINARFERNVKPLNDELKTITDRYDEIRESQERQRLEAILEDPRAPELAKELALLGLRELELRGQIDAEEEQRDVALEAANARLEAAKLEEERIQALADAQRAFIEAQTENLDLLKQQIELLEQLAEQEEELRSSREDGAGGGAGGDTLADVLGGGIGGAGGLIDFEDVVPEDFGLPSLAEIIGEGIDDATQKLEERINAFWDRIRKAFEVRLKPLLDELTTVWAEVFTTFGENKGKIVDFGIELAAVAILVGTFKLIPTMFALAGAISGFATAVKLAILGLPTFTGFLATLVGAIFSLPGLIFLAALAIGALLIKFGGFKGAADAVRETMLMLFGEDGIVIRALQLVDLRFREWRHRVETTIREWVAETLRKISEWVDNTIQNIIEWDAKFRVAIRLWSAKIRQDIALWALETLGKFNQWVEDVGASIDSWIEDTKTNIGNWISDTIASIAQWVLDMLAEFETWRDNAIKAAGELAQGILDTIAGFASSWLAAGQNIVQGIIDGVSSKFTSLTAIIRSLGQSVLDAWNGFFGNDSPSKVMMESANDVIAGFVLGMRSALPELAQTMATAGFIGQQAFVGGAAGTSSSSVVFGDTYINNGMDAAVFEARVRRIVAEALP